MSKYGRMRKSNGFSKYLLTETLAEHDATMDHPFMKTIYDTTVDKGEYFEYLISQLTVFLTLEHLVDKYKKEGKHVEIIDMFDDDFPRAEKIRADIQFFRKIGWAESSSNQTGKATIEYVSHLETCSKKHIELVLIHHMMQYLGLLSGGQYLSQMISKRLDKENVSRESGEGVQIYNFNGTSGARVQEYMDTMDKLSLETPQADLLACAKDVYKMTLAIMNEVHKSSLNETEKKSTRPKEQTGENLKLTLEELAQYNGVTNSRIIFSIRRKLYDVTEGSSFYGKDGGYHMFAGNDCTKCLGSMNLGRDNLNDLDYEPTGKELETLVDWEKKLGAKYPICGELIGVGKSANVSAEKVDAACPMTGATGGSCPFGSSDSNNKKEKKKKEECPWPFIWLHAPTQALAPKHATKNIIAGAAICLFFAYAFIF